MPIRIPCSRVTLSPGSVVRPSWGTQGLARPLIDLHAVGPLGRWAKLQAQIDSAADYTLLASGVAANLGLTLPCARQVRVSGTGGTQTTPASFPPDGTVGLFVTDYREYPYLAQPLVGFHAHGRGAAAQRSVLGLTGFLQHFRFVLDLTASPPGFELQARPGLPGSVGTLPLDRSLADFIASLRGTV